ncbi:hypothetical protein WR25_05618 isoform E [Diploscapter pachys]|uniref:Uncharacterized protein n=1 Tax=Diploscapter pachys TaxID=2018661 RepID=A0A2A2JR27_9BILA|nr:hypothetical protein WR25_05618 isoform A [Diploscapter pachys]PAV64118.1 hypothetical protein WR25_05618 isoform B [Diploscapter pachys]PAV64119.1 hypothetical protein WR25_05618 isoform C [Diploscapter pachys]PAV64120.1 hypothetical protein WR25_05618 isoform D [Diploscapter pachys]PAV64121.1 hypothetical protein WR25_05618 isoform E [Diploscapter pachys]
MSSPSDPEYLAIPITPAPPLPPRRERNVDDYCTPRNSFNPDLLNQNNSRLSLNDRQSPVPHTNTYDRSSYLSHNSDFVQLPSMPRKKSFSTPPRPNSHLPVDYRSNTLPHTRDHPHQQTNVNALAHLIQSRQEELISSNRRW